MHSRIGVEPSGRAFNEFVLDRKNKPHNPMINAGAIVSCSLIRQGDSSSTRFAYLLKRFSDFAGGAKIGFDQATYLSEKDTADRNYALAYYMVSGADAFILLHGVLIIVNMMRQHEHGVFPPTANINDTLEFYFQVCSILVTARKLSVMAGTLANGGVCPLTNKFRSRCSCSLVRDADCRVSCLAGAW